MMSLNELEKQYYNFKYKFLHIKEFEKWVYSSEQLEDTLSEDDYLNIISIHYNLSNAYENIDKILVKYVSTSKLETYYLYDLLMEARDNIELLGTALMIVYDLYCYGYDFLCDLGMGFGLRCVVPLRNNPKDSWDDLSDYEMNLLVTSFKPEVDEYIDIVINWIRDGKIILCGPIGEHNKLVYKDNRSEFEREPKKVKIRKFD